jgi:hypothetical protein
MNKQTVETLAIRLDRLERENRRLKRTGAVALVGIAALVLMGQTTPGEVANVVEAKQFVLRDSRGDTRAVLALGPDGSVGLGLSDKAGTAGAHPDQSSSMRRPPRPDRRPIILTRNSGYGTRDETLKATRRAMYGAT